MLTRDCCFTARHFHEYKRLSASHAFVELFRDNSLLVLGVERGVRSQPLNQRLRKQRADTADGVSRLVRQEARPVKGVLDVRCLDYGPSFTPALRSVTGAASARTGLRRLYH